jgi:hypothetical protein
VATEGSAKDENRGQRQSQGSTARNRSHAVAYAERGWPVFLVAPRGKLPLIPESEGGHGCKDATADAARAGALWTANPGANIGLACGAASGVWALDIDGAEGEATLARLVAIHGPLPETVEARTPRGGRHLLFRFQPERPLKNRRNAGGNAKIDTRTEGGYIVVEPSEHPEGGTYRWTTPINREIPYAPAWLLDAVDPPQPERPTYTPAPTREAQDREGKYCAAALRAICGRIAAMTDGRRSALLTEGYKIGGWVGAGLLRMADAEHDLIAAGIASGTKHNVQATVRYALETGAERPLRPTLEDRPQEAKRNDFASQEPHDGPPPVPADAYDEPTDAETLRALFLLVTVAGVDVLFVRRPKDAGDGYTAATARQVPMLLDRHWPSVPIRNDKGKLLDVAELLVQIGAVATAMVYDLTGKHAHYDGDGIGGTLYMPCVQRRPIVPKFHPQIDRWLRLLAGPRYARLEAWLATVGMLERPAVALYLKGEPGCGKGMLPLGVARLWGMEIASYRDVFGSAFNSALRKSPIVFLDEGMGRNGDNGGNVSIDTETFRNFIGSSAHTLTEKFKPSATLLGCPRLIVSANHYDALRIRTGDTHADDAAIGERILLIEINEDARAYLASIGGRATTEAWVAGDELPAHIAWLEVNRRPAAFGARWLVDGDGLWSEVQRRVRDEQIKAAQAQTTGTPLAAKVGAYLDAHPGAVRMDDVLRFLGLPTHDEAGPTPEQQATESQIAAIFRARGFEKHRRRIDGERAWAYWPPVPSVHRDTERHL